MTDSIVTIWDREIGAVSWKAERGVAVFQYNPEFLESEIQVAPIMMPLQSTVYSFPALPKETFKGLPGLLADSLPDTFGNAVINTWLALQGRDPASFNPVERLCYIGKRGMGALEFVPALRISPEGSNEIEVAKLVELANLIVGQKESLNGVLTGQDDREALGDILRVSSSAGGARAKAVLAWNPKTNEFRSGQINNSKDFEQWILKFDGISNNRDKELADPQGYGKIEYAFSLMARLAGIEMSETRLFHEGGRSHFMIKRFDRKPDGEKIHMQSLGAMVHIDYNQAGLYSYEQALQIMKILRLPVVDLEQQVLRAFFNVVGRNHDDHVKNIAFLMDQQGVWRLSPAFDLTYAYDPRGMWTNQHQMSINNKRDGFSKEDLLSLSSAAGIKRSKAEEMLELISQAVDHWLELAEKTGVDEEKTKKIQSTFRVHLLNSK